MSAAYEDDVTSDGYVNNSTRVWCWRPDLLASFQNLRADLLAESSLSRREVAVMVAATAAARGDAYCALAWGSRLAELSDEATAARVLQGRDARLSDREATLADWSRRVIHDPNATTKDDVMRLRDAGFSYQEIFEATTWIAFRMAFSTINGALGATPDLTARGKGAPASPRSRHLWPTGGTSPGSGRRRQPPSSRDLALLVTERECNSGQDAEGRVRLIELIETADAVKIMIGVDPTRTDGAKAVLVPGQSAHSLHRHTCRPSGRPRRPQRQPR